MLPLGAITEEQFDRILPPTCAACCSPSRKRCRCSHLVHPLSSPGRQFRLRGRRILASTAPVKPPCVTLPSGAGLTGPRDTRQRRQPRPVKTPGLGDLVPEEQRQGLYDALAAGTAGSPGAPGEVGKAVAFLASDAASFINATELFVDGGMAQISGYASSVRFGLRLWAEAAAAVHIPASPAGGGRGSSSHRAGGDYREDRFCVMPDLRPAVLRYGERSQAAAAYTDAAADSAPVRRTQLHDLPQIHHCHPVAHVPDHRDVVRIST